MNCKDCKDRIQYDIDLVTAFAERTVKRLWIVVLILIILLVGSNAMWLYYESKFKDEISTSTSTNQEVVQDAETGGSSGFKKYPNCGGDGVVRVRRK